jgi:hypothetical protein
VVNINFSVWLEILDDGIPLLLLIALGLTVYRGFRKNSALLAEGEDLLKRYLVFRTLKQIRLKTSTEDRETYQELIKTISNSWKNFKKTYDQNFVSISENTARTRLYMQRVPFSELEAHPSFNERQRALELCPRHPQFLSVEGSDPTASSAKGKNCGNGSGYPLLLEQSL